MKILNKEIPKEFLEALPEGMKLIHKNGNDFLVVEMLQCPYGHSLMSESVKIYNEKAIKLRVDLGDNNFGLLFVDSFWGTHIKLYNFPILDYQNIYINDILCPVCNKSLLIEGKCEDESCKYDKLVEMFLPGGKNRVLACARLGCYWHKLELKSISENIVHRVDKINYFGIGFDDDIFRGV